MQITNRQRHRRWLYLRATEMNNSRLITGGRRLLRLLCTEATVTESPKKKSNLYQRLSELEKTGRSVSQTLNEYILEGKVVGKGELDKCVQELRKYHRFQHAFEIMEWMRMRKIKFSWENYSVHLDLVSKSKGVVEAENYFNSLPPPAKNLYTYGSLLNCYCKELLIEKALAHFNKMDELGYVNSLAFTNLMSMFMRLGQPFKVHQLVNDMKQRKFRMSALTYFVWMNSFASLNDLDGVHTVYKEMKKEDQDKIDWKTFSNLAAIFVKAKQFKKAELMLSKLEKIMKPCDRGAYHCLLTLYGGTGNVDEVYRVWNLLKSIHPVNKSYLIMLSTLQRLNDMKGIIKCFEEWKSSFVNFDRRLIGFAVSAYLSQNMDEEAALVLKEVMGRCEKGTFFGVREMFMMHFLEKGQLDGALTHLEAVLSEVKEIKWRPPPKVVSAFLKYYKEKTDLDGVDELCKIFKTHNFDDSCLKTCMSSSLEAHSLSKEDSYVNNADENLCSV